MSVALSASQKVTGSASRASHESQTGRNPGAIMQPGPEHHALARPGNPDHDRQRQPCGRVERRVQTLTRDAPAGSAGTKNFVAARSRAAKILPRVRNPPQWGAVKSPHLILGWQ